MSTKVAGRGRLLKQLRWPSIAGISFLLATPAVALTWQAGPVQFEQLQQSSHQLLVHPKLDQMQSQPKGLSLFNQGHVTFDEAIRMLLRDELNQPIIATTAVDTTAKSFGLKDGGQSIDYTFKIAGVPLCGYQVRAHRLSDGSAFVLGSVPDIDAHEIAPTDWPELELAIAQGGKALKAQTGSGELRLGHTERCLYVSGGKLLPVWRMSMYASGSPYIVLADAYEVVQLDTNFFDVVSGTAKAYPRNIITDTAATVALTGLTGDGTLTSAYLQTVVPAGVTQAKQTDEAFIYPDTDGRFSEVQAYVHAVTHFSWFQSIGFEWYGPQPLQIKIHVAPNGVPNNALFTPGVADDGTLPSIQIDNGDGKVLQNLVTDGDVVSHEMGHHIIYKTLTTTSGESLVLHEGLADSFVFLRTGDPCLGRSICPLTSTACTTQGQCLRSGTLSVAYNDAQWVAWAGPQNILAHKHGQLISGILWDLVKSGMAAKDVTALTFKAISLFKTSSGLCDFTASLYAADTSVFAGANAAKLTTILTNRGMTPFLPTTTPACATLPGASGGLTTETGTATPKKKSAWYACGVVAGESPAAAGVLLLILAAPLLLCLDGRRVLQRVRAQGKRAE